jgi:hypothetical protein
VAELLKAHYADENARKNGVAGNGGNSEISAANIAGAADVDGGVGVVNNDASQRQSRHDRMVAELLKDYFATHGASEALFIERTVAGLNNGAKAPLANAADAMSPADIEFLLAIETDSEDDDANEGDDAVRSYVHPYVWKCVDDGDQQGCGVVMKSDDPTLVKKHRECQIHAHGIALGSPDLSEGIRDNGWHCVDVGDTLGCGTTVSMNRLEWCANVHSHLTSPKHAELVAERRRVTMPVSSKRKSKAPASKDMPGAMYSAGDKLLLGNGGSAEVLLAMNAKQTIAANVSFRGSTSSFKRARTEHPSIARQSSAFSQSQQFILKSWFNVSQSFLFFYALFLCLHFTSLCILSQIHRRNQLTHTFLPSGASSQSVSSACGKKLVGVEMQPNAAPGKSEGHFASLVRANRMCVASSSQRHNLSLTFSGVQLVHQRAYAFLERRHAHEPHWPRRRSKRRLR